MLNVLPRFVVVAVLSLCVVPAARADILFGIVDGFNDSLAQFDSAAPGTFISNVTITGLQSGERIIGMDRRPENGALYVIGDTNRLYTINPTTAAATQVGSAGAFTINGSIGMSFDPTADVLRVVTTSGQNLQINPNTGALIATNTPLAYAAGDPHAGATPSIAGAAYTNNFPGATSTTLYDIDSSLDTLVRQNPVNAGTLQTVGSLGVVTSPNRANIDISGSSGTAFATLDLGADNFSKLYSIDLATGAATLLGSIGNNSPFDAPLIGLTGSVGPAPAPEPSSLALVGIGGMMIGYLVRRKRKASGGQEPPDRPGGTL